MHRGILVGIVALLLTSIPWDPPAVGQAKDAKKEKKKEKKDDKTDEAKRSAERIRQYMKQLHARFDAWDSNNDNRLDAAELAKAFRGPKAVPLDKLKIKLPTAPVILPPDPPVVDDTRPGKVRSVSLALLALPQPHLPTNCVLAELLVERRLKPATPPMTTPMPPVAIPDFTRFGDYQLLAVAGKGKDWNLSRGEFEAFAKNYAQALDRMEEVEHDLKQAKAALAKAATAKAKAAAQKELAQASAEAARAQTQWNAFPLAVHQALKIKH